MGNDIRLATLAALLASWGAAQAMQPLKRDEHPFTPPANTMTFQGLPDFSALDIDGDNNISEHEASNHPGLSTLFAEIDKNHDGHLSAREYAAAKIKLKK